MKQYLLVVVAAVALLTFSCATTPDMRTDSIPLVKSFDVQRFTGLWYEIARMPFFISNKLVNTTDNYILQDDGTIEILYEGYKKTPEGKKKTYRSVAWTPDARTPGLLKVRFSGLFTSDYRVIALNEKDYRYIMVTSNSKRFLWILSRTPELDTETYEMLVSMAERNGFDVQKLQKVEQNWENTDKRRNDG